MHALLDLRKRMRGGCAYVEGACAYVDGIPDLAHVTTMDPTFSNHVLCFLNITFYVPYCICLSFVPCFCLYVHVCHAQVGLLDMNFGGSGNQTTNVEEQA